MTIHNLPLPALAGSTSSQFGGSLQWTTPSVCSFAPILYTDFSVSLNAPSFPFNAAVTVGQKFGSYLPYYYEVLVAGTAGSTPSDLSDVFTTNTSQINVPFTSGTATFVRRLPQRWALATRDAGWPDPNNWGYMYVYAKAGTNYTTTLGQDSTTVYTTRQNNALISASAATDVVGTFQAGAGAYCTETGYGYTTYLAAGFIRGLNIGRAPGDTTTLSTPASSVGAAHVYSYTTAYDCTITSVAVRGGVAWSPSFMVGGTAVRCAFANAKTTNAAALFGGYSGAQNTGGVIGGTISRGSSTIQMFSTASQNLGTSLQSLPTASFPSLYALSFAGVAGTPPMWAADATPTLYDYATPCAGPKVLGSNITTYTPSAANRFLGVNVSSGTTDISKVPEVGAMHEPSSASKVTTVYRTAGAVDAGVAYSMQFLASDIPDTSILTIWFDNNKVDESYTVSLEGLAVVGSGTGITSILTDDVWMDVVFLSSAADMRGGFVSTRTRYNSNGMSHLSAEADVSYVPAASSTWSGQPANSVKFKLSCVITPRRAGPVRVNVGAGLSPWTMHRYSGTSISIYIDPRVILEAAP